LILTDAICCPDWLGQQMQFDRVKRREFITLLGGAAAASAIVALPRNLFAQGLGKSVRIGWLTAQREASLTPFLAALRAAFADLGYVEGRNFVIEYRYGDDDLEPVPALAAELVQLRVDVILAQGAAVALIPNLRLPVPVVYGFSGDPVSAGFADSLAHPRGNMTGLTFMAAELNGKRLELLREIVPNLHRVAIMANPAHPGEQLERGYTQEYGRQLGLEWSFSKRPMRGARTKLRGRANNPATTIVSQPLIPKNIYWFAMPGYDAAKLLRKLSWLTQKSFAPNAYNSYCPVTRWLPLMISASKIVCQAGRRQCVNCSNGH
jgi:hypothetical protein